MKNGCNSGNISHNLNNKLLKKLFFIIILLAIPFYQIYMYGLIFTDYLLFLLIYSFTLEAFLKGKVKLLLWPGVSVAVTFLILYIIVIGLGGFNLQSKSFFFAYLQHAYAPLYAITVMAIGYNLYRENSIAEITRYIAYIGLVVCLINFIITFGDFLYGGSILWFFSHSGKLYFPFNRSSQLAGFLVCSFPFIVAEFAWRKREKTPFWIPFLLISFVFIFVSLRTGSRSGFAVITIEVLAMFLGGLWLSQWKGKIRGFVLSCFFLGLGYYLISHVVEHQVIAKRAFNAYSYAMEGESIFVPDARMEIWQSAWFLIKNHPWIGGGLSATKTLCQTSVHNIYYGMMAEAGIGGAILISLIFICLPLMLFLKIIKKSKNKYLIKLHYPLMVALCGQSVFGIFHYTLKQRWVWLLVVLAIEGVRQLSKYNNKTGSWTKSRES